jgi:hypothetical protein
MTNLIRECDPSDLPEKAGHFLRQAVNELFKLRIFLVAGI